MTNFQLPHNSSLSEQVVKLVETKIAAGEYKIGDRLPTESELAASYRVSRTVVREAMKALRERGVVETRPGRGTILVGNVNRGVMSTIDYMLRINPEMGVYTLLEVRELIEPGIAAMAAQRASEQHLQRLKALVDVMDEYQDDTEQFSQADFEFHNTLVEATDNPIMAMLYSSVVEILRNQQAFHVSIIKSGALHSQHNHKKILQAVLKKDAEAAGACMKEHLLQVRDDLQQVLKLSEKKYR